MNGHQNSHIPGFGQFLEHTNHLISQERVEARSGLIADQNRRRCQDLEIRAVIRIRKSLIIRTSLANANRFFSPPDSPFRVLVPIIELAIFSSPSWKKECVAVASRFTNISHDFPDSSSLLFLVEFVAHSEFGHEFEVFLDSETSDETVVLLDVGTHLAHVRTLGTDPIDLQLRIQWSREGKTRVTVSRNWTSNQATWSVMRMTSTTWQSDYCT